MSRSTVEKVRNIDKAWILVVQDTTLTGFGDRKKANTKELCKDDSDTKKHSKSIEEKESYRWIHILNETHQRVSKGRQYAIVKGIFYEFFRK